jgi:hypothetical protein
MFCSDSFALFYATMAAGRRLTAQFQTKILVGFNNAATEKALRALLKRLTMI